MDIPDIWIMLLLVVVSLAGGIGITAIGPGGVLVTIALFLLTGLSPAEVAGTAIVTHIGTGIAGSVAYVRSGQLREPDTRRLALVLCLSALIGTPAGVVLNTRLSGDIFGILLAILVMAVGGTVLWRERRHAPGRAGAPRFRAPLSQAAMGGSIAFASGIFGVGGPMLSVPVMVLGGLPILPALAAAQAQSIVVAATGATTYLAHDAITWPLAILTGIPQLVGVWIGWRIAHAIPRRPLTHALALTLIALGPVIALMRLAA